MTDKSVERRVFLKGVAAVAAGMAVAGRAGAQAASAPADGKALQTAVVLGMLPDLPIAERLQLARECGLDGVEIPPVEDPDEAEVYRKAAEDAGIRIHSIIYGGWHAPFSSPDMAVIDQGLAGVEAALRCAKIVGADTVLLVPAVVNENTRYADAYERSQTHIRKLLPLAEETGVVIAVENVWNNFLLSPLEFARYVDEFESPWLRAYFDVGNIVAYGWPQDWIRTLGERIVKVHVKDFRKENREWKNVLDGDVNWPEVRRALAEVGYTGFITAEVEGGDRAYITDLAQRLEKIAAGG